MLRVHGADILRFNPDFVHDPSETDQDAFLVQKGDETVGVVLLRTDGETADVLLDYVTPRYRDFSPGEFVWRRSGMLDRPRHPPRRHAAPAWSAPTTTGSASGARATSYVLEL